MLTGSVVSQLDNPSLRRYSVYHHDNTGRVVFSSSTNHLPGYDRTYTNYTHTGSAKLEILEQTTEGSINPVTEKYVYSYDHAGRLTSIDHSYNTNPAVRIAQNSYDNTGRLASVGRNSTNALLTQYSYNVRSWITGITSPGFNQEIVYNRDNGGVMTGYFGGNILETKWRHTPSSTQQGYTFYYDNLSRLTSAVFASGTQAAGRFNESASYDSNGNIASLTRNATSGVIDSLAYQYRGNMMIRITDNAPAVLRDSGFVYRAPANPEDIAYTYNRNGAMISDYNRRVEIEYNLLNLPQRVTNTMDTTKSIAYSYDSGGGKLRRQAMDGGVVTSTVDYAGNKLYTDGTLSKVLIPGGYIEVEGSQASYMFFATDHLGSVRQVLDSNGAQHEQNDYYPFGMQQKRGGYLQTTTNKYKYNGKEQDKFGDFTTLDYGARFYDPAIARWNTVDPLAEEMPEWSPYSFSFNNPIFFIDPDGMKPTPSQAASMAWHIYDGKKGQIVDGWTLSDVYLNDKNPGYKAGLYTRKVDGVMEYTMVNMGTIPGVGKENRNSMWENVEQPFGVSDHMKLSLDKARELSNTLGADADLTFVGHSKGGVEAAANAVATNRDAYVFNPAAVSLKAYGLNSKNYSASMTAFVVKGDPVAKTYPLLWAKPIDKLIMLPRQSWTNPIENHNNFGEALRQYLENNTIQD